MKLDFKPDVGLVSSTRRFVSELFASMLVDPDTTSRVALTVHELLENIVKYSTDGNGKLEVGIEDDPAAGHVLEISASNRTTPERVNEVRRRISDLSELTDPMEAYVRMMRESVMRGGSELGLARIRVEGEMALGFSAEGDHITITARTTVGVVR